MSGPARSGLPKFTIALTAYQWTAVVVGAPFVVMLATKASWEVFSWWAEIIFESETGAEIAAGIFTGLSWALAFSVAVTFLAEGLVAFSIRKRA